MKKGVELPEHLMVTMRREAAIEAEIQRRRSDFLSERLEQKRRQLGNEEFKKQRDKLTKEFEQAWEQLQEAKAALRGFEDQMSRKIMDWTPVEKAYRTKFEAEGWSKAVVERTMAARRRDFERAQTKVKARLRVKVDPDADFRKRVLNPETRREAIQHYLVNHTHRTHFLTEAFELLFQELEKRKLK